MYPMLARLSIELLPCGLLLTLRQSLLACIGDVGGLGEAEDTGDRDVARDNELALTLSCSPSLSTQGANNMLTLSLFPISTLVTPSALLMMLAWFFPPNPLLRQE